MKYPLIHLHPGRDQSLERRHQWIFSKAIRKKDESIRDGDIVSVCDSSGDIRATAHYQDRSLALRILEFGETSIDEVFWLRKLQAAIDYRSALGLTSGLETNAYRLVHGEGDTLPGLIIDIYDRVAVFQAHSIGMYRQRHDIARALLSLNPPGIQSIFDKSSDLTQQKRNTEQSNAWIAGKAMDEIVINEHGVHFAVDVVNGQKTGFFLDQRLNRAHVRSIAAGKDVLNCFSYTGGFSLYALAGNARHVTSVDSSSPSIELLENNLRLNTFPGTHQAVVSEVLRYLSTGTDTYDLVICDPPAFAKSIRKRHNAVQAYKRLNILAIKKVRPGGMLFTFSCSQVVDRQLFYDTIVAAAIDAGRPVRVMHELSQGPDHPVSIFHPEGSYLKGLALYVG